MREISDKKLAEILKECHEADEMMDKADSKLVIMLIIWMVLFVLFMVWHKLWWFC